MPSPAGGSSPKAQGHRLVEGHWEEDEFVTYGSAGNEIRLSYELLDHCNFRASEIKEFHWSFKVSDILGDGIISTREVRRALNRLGEEPTDKEFLRIMNIVDPHAGGRHTFQQFVKILGHFDRSMLTEDELINAFRIFDKDKSGSIDAIEMQDLMKKLGFPVTPLEAHKLIAEADDDGSGEVSYAEFVNKVLNNH